MKTLTLKRTLALWWIAFCSMATTAWAADAVRHDHSNLFVWIFLAFCAIIVIAQLIPAAMMMLGFARGAKKEAPQPVPVLSEDFTDQR